MRLKRVGVWSVPPDLHERITGRAIPLADLHLTFDSSIVGRLGVSIPSNLFLKSSSL